MNETRLRWFRSVYGPENAHPSSHDQYAMELVEEIERLQGLLNTPEVNDFTDAVRREAAHQRERWGTDHDAGKQPEDWFWLLGYLAGKALSAAKAGNRDKALHHTISSAAALANWHVALLGADNRMRPGIDPPERLIGSPDSLMIVDDAGEPV